MIADPTKITVAEVVELYRQDIALRISVKQFSPTRRVRTEGNLNDFVKHFGHQTLTECKKSDLTRWLLLHPGWKSDHTKVDAIRTIVTCFRWAEDEGYIPFVPYRKPRSLRFKIRPRNPITPEEYQTFMLAAKNEPGSKRKRSSFPLRCAVYFMARTAARTCEMRRLRWSEVQWEKGVVCLAHHKTEGVSDEDRNFGLDDRVLRLLRWLERKKKWDPRPCDCELFKEKGVEHRVDDHVFRSGWTSAWSKDTFARLFRTYANRAGIDKSKSAYSLRHGFVVSAIEHGANEREIADQLGHKSSRYVDWYGRKSRQRSDHLRRVVSKSIGAPLRPLAPEESPPPAKGEDHPPNGTP